MKASKYAPKTPAETLAQSKAEKLQQDKDRITRLLGRVRWKAEMLTVSYLRTMEIMQAAAAEHHDHDNNDKPPSVHALGSGASSPQAESMFKVDFFEFYTLLERYMTDCLALFGQRVSSAVPTPSQQQQQQRQNFNALRYETNPELHRTRPPPHAADHAFHANLLAALDDAACPLAASLGRPHVRAQLGVAKEYRNAWKHADVKFRSADSSAARKNVPLQELQLEGMLRTIVWGCELAHATVLEVTPDGAAVTSRDFEPASCGVSRMEIEDLPFEYMEDAMDLD